MEMTTIDVLKFLIGFGVNLQGVSVHIHWMLFFPLAFMVWQIDKARMARAKKKQDASGAIGINQVRFLIRTFNKQKKE